MRFIVWTALLATCNSAMSQSPPPAQPPAANQPSASQRPSDADIIALENSMLKAATTHDLDTLGSLLGPDFVSVASKINDRQATLDVSQQGKIKCGDEPFVLSHPVVSVLSNDVATIVYEYSLSGTCDQGQAKLDVNATSVWVRRSGKWQIQLHTERPLSGFVVRSN